MWPHEEVDGTDPGLVRMTLRFVKILVNDESQHTNMRPGDNEEMLFGLR